jgi:hypothetical protein
LRFVTPRPGQRVATGLGKPGQTNPVEIGQGLVVAVAVTAPIGHLPVVPGLITTPTAPPDPNPHFPTFVFTYSLPLITPAGGVIPPDTNLAGLFQMAGSAGGKREGMEETTLVWFVGGSVPTDATRLTMQAEIVDRIGMSSVGRQTLTVEPVPIAGAEWTAAPWTP